MQRDGDMKRILFVDDDLKLLAALRAVFRRERDRWETVFVGSGEEALAELGRGHFDLVVSDHRMPNMDGLELLERVRERSPTTIRLMLSGTSDRPAEELDRVVERVISKPCATAVLRETLERALEARRLVSVP
jgi:CheY-like chemotaxis protein